MSRPGKTSKKTDQEREELRRSREKLERSIQYIAWMKWIESTNNKKFLPLFLDQHKHLILKGGGGSGKSIFAGNKILNRCKWEPGHRVLVLRRTAKSLRQSCFHQLCSQAARDYRNDIVRIPQGSSCEMYLQFKNGSEIIFAGLDDVEKLKSIHDITMIWIEEATEVKEDDFDQLDIRLRGHTKYYKQIIVTFNPISVTHWLKKRFFDGCKDPRVRTHESTYLDNRFLQEEDRLTLEQFKYTNYYYYTVYCLGMWGVIGKCFFNSQNVQNQLEKGFKPQTIGTFAFDYDGLAITNVRYQEDSEGWLQILRPPERGRPYVIGADTAGEGSDAFVAQVLDNVTGLQVAKLKGSYTEGMDEGIFTHLLYCLGIYYNTALVAIEANFSTYPIEEMRRLEYPRLWVREVVDKFTGDISMSYGFRTTKLTRAVILGALQSIVRETPEWVQDRETLEEMLTFTLNEEKQLRPEAEANSHDDCVMSLAIAYNARGQQTMTVANEPDKKDTKKWTEDMWEDYRMAGSEEKRELLQLWGRPGK